MASALLGEESQWAHLLQPIKDMAANWDINIAHELEEYLVRRRRIRAPWSPGLDLAASGLACLLRVGSAALPLLWLALWSAQVQFLTQHCNILWYVATSLRRQDYSPCTGAAQEELEHITFSFEGGPTLNFAEGAPRVAACPARPPPLCSTSSASAQCCCV